jgi:hypothetical protein
MGQHRGQRSGPLDSRLLKRGVLGGVALDVADPPRLEARDLGGVLLDDHDRDAAPEKVVGDGPTHASVTADDSGEDGLSRPAISAEA